VIVGARMPYDIPLVKYGKDDVPWCASASYAEMDWMGETWNV
jgi:tyrosyl-DNA phosphodiesterase-1